MIKKLLLFLLVCHAAVTYAQNAKTDIIVIGGSAGGIAAALQSARSKLKTILVIPDSKPGESLPAGNSLVITTNSNLPTGTWGEFRRLVRDHYKKKPGFDTAYNAPLKLDRQVALEVFKELTDTVKNLGIYVNSSFASIKKDGDRWDVGITQDGKINIVKARVVIDATEKGDVLLKAGAKASAATGSTNSYRTAIAAVEALPSEWYSGADLTKTSYPQLPSLCIPLNAGLTNADNLLTLARILPLGKDINYLPVQLALGQGLGTIAAYCAFFKTTTQHLKVRIIQGELLDFKGDLLPFTDIRSNDANWRAIQQVSATGLLKGMKRADGTFAFTPDSTVTTADIKPVLDEIYTRSFLWFNKEKTGDQLTVANLISFISDYTLTDPQTLQSTLQKNWKAQYKFKLDYDLKRAVTRLEFAVLANRYLNPFARTVDLSGRLVN